MAASYSVSFRNGVSPGTATTITNARLRTDDNNTADLTNPCIIGSSLNYSYWKHIELAFSGTFTQISNIRHYSDGTINTWTLGTNGKLVRGNRDSGDNGCPTASYQQAAGTTGTTGFSISDATNGHAFYKSQVTPTANVNSDVSGSPATIDTTAYTSAGQSKGVVLQLLIDTAANGAVQGVMAAKTLTFIVDEI